MPKKRVQAGYVQLNYVVPAELADAIRRIAQEKGYTYSQVVQEFLKDRVDRWEEWHESK